MYILYIMSSPQYYNSSDSLYCKDINVSGTIATNEIETVTIKCDLITELNQNYIAFTSNLVLNTDGFILTGGNVYAGNVIVNETLEADRIKYNTLDPAISIPLTPIIIQKASGTTNPIRFLRIGGGGLFDFSTYFEFELDLDFKITNVFSSAYNLALALSVDNGVSYLQDNVELVSHEMTVASGSYSIFQRFNSSFNYGADGFYLCGTIPPDWNGNLRLKFRSPDGSRTSASFSAYFQKAGVGISRIDGSFGLNSISQITNLQFSLPTGFIVYSYNLIAYPR